MFDLFVSVPGWWICWRAQGQISVVRGIITTSLRILQACSPTRPTPATNGLQIQWGRRRARECVLARVWGLSFETNYWFSSGQRRGSGGSHCGVKSLAKHVSFVWMMEASLWQPLAGNMSTRWQMPATERLWWLFSWPAFRSGGINVQHPRKQSVR